MQTQALDRFGIAMLFPTVGRTWTSAWDNHFARTVCSVNVDECDCAFWARGSGTVIKIDGEGVATMSGEQPRMYVYEDGLTWNNVEITFYAKRISETREDHRQGFVAGARSEHQAVTRVNNCPGYAYYGRMLYDGSTHFVKELTHSNNSSRRPDGNPHANWGTPDGEIPRHVWIGYKFIVRNARQSANVKLCLFRDQSEGASGGNWELLCSATDTGDWPVPNVILECGYSPNTVLNWPASSVFIRNTLIEATEYSKFSIREIDPEFGTADC